MLAKRIIACLDVKDGRTVKGTHFINLRDMGDPVELAAYYTAEGIDELVFLDITATHEKRKTLVSLVREVAALINIPFTVGGGISSIEDVALILENGADKISINTAAIQQPKLITDLAKRFGSQCIVLAIDTKYEDGDWFVYLNGGRVASGIKTKEWVKQVESFGAGEILLTSINNDGARSGFAVDFTTYISSITSLPVIASGGAGTMQHFKDVFVEGGADAALAAGIFHDRSLEIPVLKKFLMTNKIPVRI